MTRIRQYGVHLLYFAMKRLLTEMKPTSGDEEPSEHLLCDNPWSVLYQVR